MGAVGLVALRELIERGRSKAFLVANVIIVLAIALGVLASQLFGDPGATRLAVADEEAEELARIVEQQRAVVGAGTVEVVETADAGSAEELVREGEADLALVGQGEVLVDGAVPRSIEPLLGLASQSLALQRAVADLGVPSYLQARVLEGSLAVTNVGEDEEGPDEASALVAFGAVVALYALLIIYGQWVAQGIVEEKQSRVVEVVVSTVTPTQLLAGKVLGIGLLGLLQVLLIAGASVTGLLVGTDLALPTGLGGVIGLVLGWYILGYALYATLFAVSGAVVSRVEDLQSAATPVIIVILAAFFASQFALQDPSSTAAQVMALVPLTAPLVQPIRGAAGLGSALEVLAGAALTLAALGVLLPVVARVYAGAVLRTRGRLSLREAYRSGSGAPAG
ncbi:MAG: ABC transporter permease [Egibacteraceae bacterium]